MTKEKLAAKYRAGYYDAIMAVINRLNEQADALDTTDYAAACYLRYLSETFSKFEAPR